jgi:hypothetical protein
MSLTGVCHWTQNALQFSSEYNGADVAEKGSAALHFLSQSISSLQHSVPAQGRAILCLIVADVIINHDFKTRRNRQQHTAACQRAVWRVGV